MGTYKLWHIAFGRGRHAARQQVLAAETLYRAGKLQEAENVLSPILNTCFCPTRAIVLGGRLMNAHERWEEALAIWTRLSKRKPRLATAWYERGRALFKLGRYQDCVPVCQRALRLDPLHINALWYLARSLNHAARWPEALVAWQCIQELNPGNEDCARQIARCLLKTGRFDEAEKAFRKLVESVPEQPEAQRALAKLHRLKQRSSRTTRQHASTASKRNAARGGFLDAIDRFATASRHYLTALSHSAAAPASRQTPFRNAANTRRAPCASPGGTTTVEEKGRSSTKQPPCHSVMLDLPQVPHSLAASGSMADVSSDEGIVDMNPDNTSTGLVKGISEQPPIHPSAQASATLLASEEISVPTDPPVSPMVSDPQDTLKSSLAPETASCAPTLGKRATVSKTTQHEDSSTLHLARLLYRQKAWDRLIPYCRKALIADQSNIDLLMMLARALTACQQWPDAVEVWSQLSQITPVPSTALFQLGRCCIRQGDLPRARKAFDHLLAIIPNHLDALANQAQVLHAMGRLDEAEGLLLRLQTAHSDTPESLLAQARYFYATQQIDRAADAYQRLTDLDPANREALQGLAASLARQKGAMAAAPIYKKARTCLAANVEGHIALARLAETAQLVDEAFEHYRAAFARQPGSAAVLKALGTLYLSLGYLRRADACCNAAVSSDAVASDYLALRGRVKTLLDLCSSTTASRAAPESSAQPVFGTTSCGVPDSLGRIKHDDTSEHFYPDEVFLELLHLAKSHQSKQEQVFVPGRVVMATTQLGQGGGERQVSVTAEALTRSKMIESLSMLVRSTGWSHPKDGFFAEAIRNLPLDFVEYGLHWRTAASMPPDLFPYREWLESLPHNHREDIVRIGAELLTRRPEVLHVWQDFFAAAVAGVLCNIPRIIVHRGTLAPDHWDVSALRQEQYLRPMRKIYRALIARPGFTMINNTCAGTRTDDAWIGAPSGTSRVFYNFVNFDDLKTSVDAIAHHRALFADALHGRLVIVGAFRFVPVKQPLLWIETAKCVHDRRNDVAFLLLGDGEMRGEIKGRIEELGLRDHVLMPGLVSDVTNWLSLAHINLMTSSREGLPNVIIESQFCGLPTVTTNVGGVAEGLIPGRTGFPVTEQTPQALAERLLWILDSEAWRSDAAVIAPQFVQERFGPQARLQELLSIYGFSSHDTGPSR